MNKLFDLIQNGELSAAKDSMADILNDKLVDALADMKQAIASEITKESLSEADTYGWGTHKTPEGHEWQVHSFTYGKGNTILHKGIEDTRAKAIARAKKHVIGYRRGTVKEGSEITLDTLKANSDREKNANKQPTDKSERNRSNIKKSIFDRTRKINDSVEELDEEKVVTNTITPANDRYYSKHYVNKKHYPHLDFSSDNKEEVEAHAKKHTERLKNSKLDKIVKEAWDAEMHTPESKKGMFKGRTKDSLKSELASLKKSGPHKEGSAEATKEKELDFALRAKNNFGSAE